MAMREPVDPRRCVALVSLDRALHRLPHRYRASVLAAYSVGLALLALPAPNALSVFLGAAVTTAGLLFAVWARVHLGRNWSSSACRYPNTTCMQRPAGEGECGLASLGDARLYVEKEDVRGVAIDDWA
jgi:hypothetical protein